MEGLTIEKVLEVFKNYSDEKKIKDIKNAVISTLYPDELFVDPTIVAEIEAKVDDLIKEDKKQGDISYLTYNRGKYKKRRRRAAPADGNQSVELQGTAYIGTAGECAVMSELLFKGYNANRMMIDEGVDIIAVKNNYYYYIQVKTTTLRDGRIYCSIGLDRFSQHIGVHQIRYIIVARYKDSKGMDGNMFFTFTHDEIQKYIYQHYIKRGESSINIKIKFHELSGEPLLYDKQEVNISWNLNKFDL
jgi:hypothetical protein